MLETKWESEYGLYIKFYFSISINFMIYNAIQNVLILKRHMPQYLVILYIDFCKLVSNSSENKVCVYPCGCVCEKRREKFK